MKKKVLIKSPILSRSGYGTQSMFLYRALSKYDELFDIYLIPTSWGQCGWLHEDTPERAQIDNLIQKTIVHTQNGGTYDISVQVTIPNEFDDKLAPINIGYTAGIETSTISAAWVQPSNLMNKIITVSEFAKQGFENSVFQVKNQQTGEIFQNYRATTPIEAIEYPALLFDPDPDFTTQLDNLLTTDFNFLTVAQWSVRKNIDNTIKWFIEQFLDVNVGLILKVNFRNNSISDRSAVQEKIDNIVAPYRDKNMACSIYLLHGDLSDQQMTSLYQHSKVKAFVSLAHGEGFCLPMFESALNELPVITTNWSGYTNFMSMEVTDKKGKTKTRPMFCKVDYDLKPIQLEAYWNGVLEKNSQWSFPRESDFKLKLREVYKEYPRFKSMAIKLANNLKVRNEANKQYAKMAEAVNCEPLAVVSTDDLPKIGLYCSLFNAEDLVEGFMKDVVEQTIFEKKINLFLVHPKTSPGYKKEKEVVEKYLEKFPNNIFYKELEQDLGIYNCWNVAIKMALENGCEYVGNFNADDRSSARSTEAKAKFLYSNPEIDLVYTDMLITQNYNETFEKNSSNGRQYHFPQASFESLKMVNFPHARPLYKSRLHNNNNFFDESYRFASDWKFHLVNIGVLGAKYKKLEQVVDLYCFSVKGLTTSPEFNSEKVLEEQKIFNEFKDMKAKE